MLHQVIETLNSRVALRPRYENFIGGKWVAPVDGGYFDNVSPITGKTVCQIARSQAADIELRSTPRIRRRTPGATPRRPSAPRF